MNAITKGLDNYAGINSKCSFTRWVNESEDRLKAAGIVDGAQQVAALHSAMVGQAGVERDEYRRIGELNEVERAAAGWVDITTLALFRSYYAPKFRNVMMEQSMRIKLLRLQQGSRPLQAYILEEKDIVGSNELGDEERILYFIEGLRPGLKRIARKKEIHRFPELLREVTKADCLDDFAAADEMAHYSSASNEQQQRTAANDDNPMQVDTINLIQQQQQLQQQLQQLQLQQQQLAPISYSGQRRFNNREFNQQHHQRKFPSRTIQLEVEGTVMTVNNKQPWVREYIREHNLCWDCGGKHMVRHCPLRKGKEGGV